MNLPFVIPGHYINNETLNSDKKEYIRVLGESDRPNYFNIHNRKKPMSENEILDNYTFSPTQINEQENLNFNFGNIKDASDIEEENVPVEIYANSVEDQPIQEYQTQQTEQTITLEKKFVSKPIPQKNENEIFVDGLLKKIQSENKFEITVPLKFQFDYDINKLKDLINLLDIDKSTVNLIVNKLLNETQNSVINNSLKTTILNIVNNNIDENNSLQNSVKLNTQEEIPMKVNTEIEKELPQINTQNLYGNNINFKNKNYGI